MRIFFWAQKKKKNNIKERMKEEGNLYDIAHERLHV